MRATIPLLCSLLLAGCFQNEVIVLNDDAGIRCDTEDSDGPVLNGVDLVFVVDNSGSMSEEQSILATSVFSLVDALVSPPAGAPYDAVDDMRIAVVSSDMGVSANGAIPDETDTPLSLADLRNFGDDGAFLETSVGWIEIGGGTEIACPNPDSTIAETSPDAPNASLGLEAACLTSLGTSGCGWEQQLASAARATTRADQASFYREGAGLGIVIVSDEDDCSMDDAEGLFETPECQDPYRLNIACGMNDEYLHTAEHYEDAFAAVKGGSSESVFLAAIVGVPANDTCQGRGDSIGACLDAPEMQAAPYQPNLEEDDDRWYFEPACTRSVDGIDVTTATPGRRFVELAERMGDNAYVFSICNEDWTTAMNGFAALIAQAMSE